MSKLSNRLASLDALRGWTVAAMLLVNNPGDWSHVWAPLEHARWNGCTPTDLIFPLFLFILGASVALAIEPRAAAGRPRPALAAAALRRALRIVAVGVLLNLAAWAAIPDTHLRLPGVLQRIGICFGIAALVALYVPRRWQAVMGASLWLAYGAVLCVGGMAVFRSIPSRVDSAVFGDFIFVRGFAGMGYDPEGILSTVPAVVTTLLGMQGGRWLAQARWRPMVVSGLAALATGWAATLVWPLNKSLWSPSYVLWTAGWAYLLLALFHALVDRGHVPAWGRAFGVNAIAAYAGSALMVYVLIALGLAGPLYRLGFTSWITPWAGPYAASAAWGLAFVAVWWLIVRWMDRRGIYWKL